ncbi:hypothetical protein [Thermoactinospora rubra]|uniref:hypothetical protein n=1 Tax=Thermoactinospora rubra TaxID=1088767 RepID=UPI000A10640D|nr:hypothetical protein [Thermoactinospora rubra]
MAENPLAYENLVLREVCDRQRKALEEIARRTIQRDLNRLAHAALGHQPNPSTQLLMDEINHERRPDA